jgi:hypothetical protein
MKRHLGAFVVAALLLVSLFAAEAALAQKTDGILKMYTVDSPASTSIGLIHCQTIKIDLRT